MRIRIKHNSTSSIVEIRISHLVLKYFPEKVADFALQQMLKGGADAVVVTPI